MKKLISIALSLVLGCTMFFAFPLSANALAAPAIPVSDQAGLYVALRDGEKYIDIKGFISLTEDLVIPGGVNVSVLAGYILTIPSGFTLTNDGTLNINDWPEEIGLVTSGTLTNTGTINLSGGLGTATGTINNSGNIFIDNSGSIDGEGMIINDNKGSIIVLGSLHIFGGGVGVATIYNRGEVEIKNDGELKNNGTINNTGTINNSGAIGNITSFINDGTFINSGTFVNLTSYSELNNSGAFTNNGSINNNGIIGNGGTLDNSGTINNSGMFYNQGAISGSGSIVNPPPNITTSDLLPAIVGVPYSAKLSADNNPTIWNFGNPGEASALGLTIDSATGELSGTINAVGGHDLQIAALNDYGGQLKQYYLVVVEEPEDYLFAPGFPDVTDNTKPVEATVPGDYQGDFWSGSDGIYIYINNKLLELGTDYTTREGSLIISLNPSYLQKLSNGTYTVDAWFRNYGGKATTTLTIAVPARTTPGPTSGSTSPKTGEETNIALLLMLSLVSIAGIGTATIWRRKRPQ